MTTTTQSSIRKILIWAGSVAGATLIGLLLGDYNSRAKPSLEIASVAFSDAAKEGAKVRLSPEVMSAYEQLPYSFDGFGVQMKVELYDDLLADLEDSLDNWKTAQRALTDIIAVLKSRAQDFPKDRLRSEILSKWAAPSGNALDQTLRGVLVKYQYYRTLDQKYAVHPDPWRDPAGARVAVSAFESYNLAEDALLASDSSGNRSEKILTNLVKRLWIYVERDVLLDIFDKTDTELESSISSAEQLIQLLRAHRLEKYPKKLAARLVVSNLGKRSVILRSIGFLSLATSKGVLPVKMVLSDPDTASATSDTIVIKPESSVSLSAVSEESLQQLDKSLFPSGGGLEALYSTETVKCNFALAVMGEGERFKILGARTPVSFGKSLASELDAELRLTLVPSKAD